MSKIIVEKFENKENKTKQPKKYNEKTPIHSDEDLIEVIETEEVTIEDVEDESSVEQIVNNKNCGFRRTNPTTGAEKPKEVPGKQKAGTYASLTANKSKTSVSSPGTTHDPAPPGTTPVPAPPGTTPSSYSKHENRPA